MVVGHHDRRRGIETVHQQSAFLVDGKVERSRGLFSPVLRQPALALRHQGAHYLRVVFTFEKAEMAGLYTVMAAVQLIDLGAYAAHRPVALPGNPALPAAMGKIRVQGGEMQPAFDLQRRDP